jgi:type I restriction enzyme S subunit
MGSPWQQVALGDLIRVKHGWPFVGNLCADALTGRPIVVNIGNFRYTGGFRFDETTTREYRGEYPPEFELRSGEILLVMTCQTPGGEILGIPARVPDDGRVYLHNQRMGKVVVTRPDRIRDDYLYWLFLWRDFNQELVASSTGTKILHTGPSRIEAFRFPLPSLDEQGAIADILNALHEKIELNRQVSRTLEALADAIFKSWFVDFDPVAAKAAGRQPLGMDGTTVGVLASGFADSELGPIPKGWGVRLVRDEYRLVMGQSPPGTTYNLDGLGLPFYRGRTDFGFRFPSARVFCTAPTRFAEREDTFVSVRAPVGDVNMAGEPCAIGRGVAAIRRRSGSPSFTYYAMRHLADEFEVFQGEGTLFGSIGRADFEGIRVVVPPGARRVVVSRACGASGRAYRRERKGSTSPFDPTRRPPPEAPLRRDQGAGGREVGGAGGA